MCTKTALEQTSLHTQLCTRNKMLVLISPHSQQHGALYWLVSFYKKFWQFKWWYLALIFISLIIKEPNPILYDLLPWIAWLWLLPWCDWNIYLLKYLSFSYWVIRGELYFRWKHAHRTPITDLEDFYRHIFFTYS